MILLRHELGEVLREIRQDQGRTLRDVASSSAVSLGYLSELERGTKEASSELLASVCTGLGLSLSRSHGWALLAAGRTALAKYAGPEAPSPEPLERETA